MSHPERTLLDAIRILHARGFEAVTATPALRANGRWECAVTAGPTSEHVLHFTCDGTPTPAAEALADALQERLPDEALDRDPEYAAWLAEILEHAGPGEVFYLADDFYDAERDGYTAITGRPDIADRSSIGFRLPPA